MNNFATFVLSTGRCGTQWMADSLGKVYAERLVVEHEPLDSCYDSRSALASNRSAAAEYEPSVKVTAHVEWIEQQLETHSYIECGHPNWGVIPWLEKRFRGRVRIVHLTRHPVPCAYSWSTHGAYQEVILPHETRLIPLSPFDKGIQFNEYQQRWNTLSVFEKCLYYWCEVNAFAIELESRVSTPWLRLTCEDLFTGNGPDRLSDFLEFPQNPELNDLRANFVDRFRYLAPQLDDWRQIKSHPDVIAVADELGYSFDDLNEDAMRRRYLGIG